VEGSRGRREDVRGVAALGDDAPRASGTLGAKVQTQVGHPRGMDPGQGAAPLLSGESLPFRYVLDVAHHIVHDENLKKIQLSNL